VDLHAPHLDSVEHTEKVSGRTTVNEASFDTAPSPANQYTEGAE
jgi:hypothetical protein